MSLVSYIILYVWAFRLDMYMKPSPRTGGCSLLWKQFEMYITDCMNIKLFSFVLLASMVSKAEVPDSFRRSSEGEKAVRQAMQKMYRLHADKFPTKPLFDSEGRLRLKPQGDGHEPPTWTEIVARAPMYFCNLLFKIRQRPAYGQAVFQIFEKIQQELRADVPVRNKWMDLLKDIPKGSHGPL